MNSDESDFTALRFGLAPARPGEDWSPDGMVASLAALSASERLSLPPSSGRMIERALLNADRKNSSVADKKAAKEKYSEFVQSAYRSDVHARVVWGVAVRRPFAERLLAFWSNHFTVSKRKQVIMTLAGPYEAEALLPNIGARFVDLLKAAVKHPAMLIYLDQPGSVGPNSPAGKRKGSGLNENLAREILELHTMGVHGGYTQKDVSEFARIMTGWSIDRKNGITAFRTQQAEPGLKTLLGRQFGGNRPAASDFDEALEMIAAHPATARHVATKLVTHFISDQPPADAVAAVERQFTAAGGNLAEVYRTLAELPEARERPGAKARNDRDFLIAALRASEIAPEKLAAIPKGRKASPLTVGALGVLRQPYWDAASPAGWAEAADEWLSPAGLAGRLSLIPRLVRETRAATPAELIGRALGGVASARTRRIVTAASNREEAMAMVFASPEFNRR